MRRRTGSPVENRTADEDVVAALGRAGRCRRLPACRRRCQPSGAGAGASRAASQPQREAVRAWPRASAIRIGCGSRPHGAPAILLVWEPREGLAAAARNASSEPTTTVEQAGCEDRAVTGVRGQLGALRGHVAVRGPSAAVGQQSLLSPSPSSWTATGRARRWGRGRRPWRKAVGTEPDGCAPSSPVAVGTGVGSGGAGVEDTVAKCKRGCRRDEIRPCYL